MIKDLIKDLAYENISLSQGLTRAKLIAYKIGDETLKEWIDNEINGYKDPEKLPDYRKIPCELFGVIQVPFGEKKKIPIDAKYLDDWLNGLVYKMNVVQSVSTLEESIKKAEGIYGYENLPINLVKQFQEMTNSPELIEVTRQIQISQLNHILNITKQKLIDTLLELDKNFPNMENEFEPSKENIEKANTIVTTNIYGGNVNSNVGLGENVNQNQELEISTKNIEKKIEEIRKLGVNDEQIEQIRNIIKNEKDKTSLSKKLISWSGKISSILIEKGLEMNIPILIEKIHELIK